MNDIFKDDEIKNINKEFIKSNKSKFLRANTLMNNRPEKEILSSQNITVVNNFINESNTKPKILTTKNKKKNYHRQSTLRNTKRPLLRMQTYNVFINTDKQSSAGGVLSSLTNNNNFPNLSNLNINININQQINNIQNEDNNNSNNNIIINDVSRNNDFSNQDITVDPYLIDKTK